MIMALGPAGIAIARGGPDSGELALSGVQMATMFGGTNANNGLCCAVNPACTGAGMINCGRPAVPWVGSVGPDNSGTAYAVYCGKPPTPADAAANCGQFTNDPLGQSYDRF